MHITGQHCISVELQDVQKSLSGPAAHSNNPFSRPYLGFLVSRPLLNDTRHKSALLQRSQAKVGLQNYLQKSYVVYQVHNLAT